MALASAHDGLTEAPTLEGGDTGIVIGVRGTPLDGRVVEPAGAVMGTSTLGEGTGPTLAGKVIGGCFIGKTAPRFAVMVVRVEVIANFGKMIGSPGAAGNEKGVSA
jgi:hypothetical protein